MKIAIQILKSCVGVGLEYHDAGRYAVVKEFLVRGVNQRAVAATIAYEVRKSDRVS